MKSKSLSTLSEPLDFDLQLVATELDTSAARLRFLSNTSAVDPYEIDAFTALFQKIKTEESEVLHINDNTTLYECEEEALVIILHEDLNEKFIVFDLQDALKVERMMSSYNKVQKD